MELAKSGGILQVHCLMGPTTGAAFLMDQQETQGSIPRPTLGSEHLCRFLVVVGMARYAIAAGMKALTAAGRLLDSCLERIDSGRYHPCPIPCLPFPRPAFP